MIVVPNGRGIHRLLTLPGVRTLVVSEADELASRAAGIVGSVSGFPTPTVGTTPTPEPVMRRIDTTTQGGRARSVILANHPTPSGRDAGRDALRVVLGVSR